MFGFKCQPIALSARLENESRLLGNARLCTVFSLLPKFRNRALRVIYARQRGPISGSIRPNSLIF
jgi:hypothetical protein